MIALLFTLFCASSTDVLANFFHISLNTVLWFFRVAVIVAPIISALFAYRICLEMQGVANIGKRKRANVVTRSVDGEYQVTPVEVHPGSDHHELEPEPVPVAIDLEPLTTGAGNGGPNGHDGDEDLAGPGVRRVGR